MADTLEKAGTTPPTVPAISRVGAILPINNEGGSGPGGSSSTSDLEFILLEDGFFVLAEDGVCKIVRENT
jgi:hypothetical protein